MSAATTPKHIAMKDLIKQFEAIENLTHEAKRQVASEIAEGNQTRAIGIAAKYKKAVDVNMAIINGKLKQA